MLEPARQSAKQGLEKLFGVAAEKIKIGNEGVKFFLAKKMSESSASADGFAW